MKVLNWAGGLTAAWALFLPTPYEYAIIAGAVVPAISILALKLSRGLIRMDTKKDSAYPTILWPVMMSSCGLFLRAMLDYNIFEYRNIWMPAFLVTLTLVAVLLSNTNEFTFKKRVDYFTIFTISSIFFAYGYGAVVQLNCQYDNSTPEHFNANIISKKISSGKTTTHYLTLSPWGHANQDGRCISYSGNV